jgi:arginase
MALVLVSYHLDGYLPDLDVPLPSGTGVTRMTRELPDGDTWARLNHLYQPVADEIAGCVESDDDPATVVSGDCMTSLAAMTGLQRAGVDASLVWFDAHGDLQTLETSTSGYLGGMPLRILVGYRPELISQPLGLRPIEEGRVVLVDGRSLDPPEADFLAGSGIRRSSVDDLSADLLPAGPLMLHIDLDVVDPDELPDLLYPVPGGPGAPAVLAAARRVLETGRVAALSLGCTWRPATGDSAGLRARLLTALLAHHRHDDRAAGASYRLPLMRPLPTDP